MEPRSGLRYRTRNSVQPSIDRHQHNLTETESSDEDDDDIPATKRPSVSPAKLNYSSINAVPNHTKRSCSDAGRGGIVLYPGSKRQRIGYNMPVSRKSLALSTSRPLSATATISPTPECWASPSSDPEDDVPEALLDTVNDAIRPRQAAKTQDYIPQPSQQAEAPSSSLIENISPRKPGGRGISIDAQDSDLPRAIPAGGLTSSAIPMNIEGVNGMSEKPCQSTFGESMLAATSKKEIRTQAGVQPQVLLPVVDMWAIPISPGQPNVQGGKPDGGDDGKPLVKKRGRPRKLPVASNITESSPNRAPVAQKRKQPNRSYVANEYYRHIKTRQKTSVPCADQPSAQLPGQSPPEPIDTSLMQLEPPNPGDDAGTRPNKSQLAPILEIQPRIEEGEEANLGVNHAVLSARDFGLDDGDLDSEPGGRSDDGFDGSYAEEDDGMLSDFLHGFDTDPEDGVIVGESAKDNFEHDVNVFNTSQTHDVDDEEFEGPVDDDVSAIYLDHRRLTQLCKLLSDTSGAGAKGSWQLRDVDFDYEDAETEPARALLPLLAKLERLYQATPKDPNLKEQNSFLREHAKMLRYYFHKIKMVVDHIRTQRLESPEQNEASRNTNPRKRKRMTRDLVSYVIPMLVHVLASAWSLGGEKWPKALFTQAAVALLERTLSWIKVLHPYLLRELTRCALEESPEDEDQRQSWRKWNTKIKKIGPLLDDLSQVIAAAPDQLAETRARQALVAERKKRSLLSIYGIHYALHPSTTSSRVSPSPATISAEWSIEEQRFLFLRIQASYPVCPDLETLRWDLNKTLAQTVAKTEEILGKMLAKVLIGYSQEEQAAELHQIMRSSGVAGL
ncbi:hypothetical protein F5Y14DRAFT_406483 [Nemania sp. NC0429]|nr:hypothetical protein F5Y14DRAFT_406483 [Nemania sp. NC0429]